MFEKTQILLASKANSSPILKKDKGHKLKTSWMKGAEINSDTAEVQRILQENVYNT